MSKQNASTAPTNDADDVAVLPENQDSLSVLVVGDASLIDLLREVFQEAGLNGEAIQGVEGYLMALGHLASAAPAVLIGKIDELNGSADETVKALREMAPQTKMVLLTPPDREADAKRAVEAGFDDYLVEPIKPADLKKKLQPHTPKPTVKAKKRVPPVKPDTPPAPVKPGTASAETGESGRPDVDQPNGDQTQRQDLKKNGSPRSAQGSKTPSEKVATPAAVPRVETARWLAGDASLVEHLLEERQNLRDQALTIISQQSGLAGVGWSDDAEKVPADCQRQPVVYRQQSWGWLYARKPVAQDRLETWSAWLGRWLALDRLTGQLWDMALKDELTGVWNRRYFYRFLRTVIGQAAQSRFHVTLMVFDIDDFKTYNDRFGHAAGDEILRETARLMQSMIREHDVVARIGGDEFAVIFWDASHKPRKPNSTHPHDPVAVAQRFREAISTQKFPKLGAEAPGPLTISGGLASYPWDGRTPEELLEVADRMALQSKRQGKNVITVGAGMEKGAAAVP